MTREMAEWGDAAIRAMETLAERDKHLEELWSFFEDVPMDPETECMEERFLCFSSGRAKELVSSL